MPAPIHFTSRVAVGYGEPGVDEVVTVLPVAEVTVTPTLRVFGSDAVLTDVNGSRLEAPREAKYHLDVELRWAETGQALFAVLAPLLVALAEQPPTTPKRFYPVVTSGGDWTGGYAPLLVVVDHAASTTPFDIRRNIRHRSATLRLPGAVLVNSDDVPEWLLK